MARKSLFVFVLFRLFAVTTAIGGWQTICIFFSKWNGERAQTTIKTDAGSPRATPAITSRRGSYKPDDNVVQSSVTNKMKVTEVTMTSRSVRSTSSSAPAFVRGKRSCLDEDDLACISFVGRSPFL